MNTRVTTNDALMTEIRDSVHFEAALSFYARASRFDLIRDGGECARNALATIPSEVKVSEMLAAEYEELA